MESVDLALLGVDFALQTVDLAFGVLDLSLPLCYLLFHVVERRIVLGLVLRDFGLLLDHSILVLLEICLPLHDVSGAPSVRV